MEESEEERADEEEEGSDEEEELEIPEMLVPNRSRRANAGRKMQELLNRQVETEGGKDEFYTTAYGGFQEVRNSFTIFVFFNLYFVSLNKTTISNHPHILPTKKSMKMWTRTLTDLKMRRILKNKPVNW